MNTWQIRGGATENIMLFDMLIPIRRLLWLLSSSSRPSSRSWPWWGWPWWMSEGGGGESGVSSFLQALLLLLLLLEKLLLPALTGLFDEIYSVSYGFPYHFGIALMEKSWLHLRKKGTLLKTRGRLRGSRSAGDERFPCCNASFWSITIR